MAELLLGESKLEQFLKEHPLRQGASPRSPRPQLTEVRKHLTAALDRGNLKVPMGLWAGVWGRWWGDAGLPSSGLGVGGKEARGPNGQCLEHHGMPSEKQASPRAAHASPEAGSPPRGSL